MEMKVIALRLLFTDAVTGAVLPDIAFLTGDAVGTVVQVLPMLAADRAVEVPGIVLLEALKLLFALLHIGLQLTLRNTSPFSIINLSLSF
jgi:hypothetical protein